MKQFPAEPGLTPLRIANFLVLLACVASGVLQHNDPDPWQWAAYYTAGASVCLAYHMGKLWWQVPAVLGIYSLGWSLSLLPAFVGSVGMSELFGSLTMQTEEVEEAREAGGTLLVAGWCWVLARDRYRAKVARKQEEAAAEA